MAGLGTVTSVVILTQRRTVHRRDGVTKWTYHICINKIAKPANFANFSRLDSDVVPDEHTSTRFN